MCVGFRLDPSKCFRFIDQHPGDRCYCPVFVCLACDGVSHSVVQADPLDLVTTVVLGIQAFAPRPNCGLILKIRTLKLR